MTNPKRIVLVNVWHDDNKGDGGIAEATLAALSQAALKLSNLGGSPAKFDSLKTEVQLSIVSMFPATAAAFVSAHRHLADRFPTVRIYPALLAGHDPSRSNHRLAHLQKLWQIPIALLRLLSGFAQGHPGFRAIAEADLVIANGGQYLFTQANFLNSLFTVFRLLYPLLVARRYQVPYLFCSQSFGFHKLDRFDNHLVRSVLQGAEAIWAREALSQQALLELGVSPQRVALVPDAAFALTPERSPRVDRVLAEAHLQPQRFWVVTVRQWQTFTDGLLDEMAIVIRTALHQGWIDKVALVAHVHGPSAGENDRIATQQLAQRLSGEAIVVIEEDLSPSELAAFYGQAQLMIGTRFHSVIFALIAGTPAYAISYAGPKTWGIMDLLGMRHLCSDMEHISAHTVLEQIRSTHLSELAAEIPAKVARLRQQFEAAIEGIGGAAVTQISVSHPPYPDVQQAQMLSEAQTFGELSRAVELHSALKQE